MTLLLFAKVQLAIRRLLLALVLGCVVAADISLEPKPPRSENLHAFATTLVLPVHCHRHGHTSDWRQRGPQRSSLVGLFPSCGAFRTVVQDTRDAPPL